MPSINCSAATNLAVAALVLAALSSSRGADAARPDADLVADCVKEVASRAFEGVAAEHLLVSSSEVSHGETEDLVRIVLASGEGRSARATCKFRGGKLFDVLLR